MLAKLQGNVNNLLGKVILRLTKIADGSEKGQVAFFRNFLPFKYDLHCSTWIESLSLTKNNTFNDSNNSKIHSF